MAIPDNQQIHFEVKVNGLLAANGGSKAKPTVNLLHYTRTITSTAFSPTAFITAWLAQFKAHWKALVSTQWTMVSVTIRCLDDTTMAETVVAVGEAGTATTTDVLPNANAVVFSKRTAYRGKSGRGRMYVAGMAEDDTLGNALTNGAKTRADTLATDIKTTITDANGVAFTPVVKGVLKIFVTVPPTVNIIYNPVTDCKARQQIGSMNSRKAPVLS